MSSYVLTAATRDDMDDIYEYIAPSNVYAADTLIAELFAIFETLAGSPGLGHRRSDLTQLPVLFWSYRSYVVVYRRQLVSIEIVAVTHGARDLPRLLQGRLSK